MRIITSSLLTLIAALSVFFPGCQYTLPVKDGKTAWELRRYHQAIQLYEKEFTKAKSRVEKGKIAYRVADAAQRTGDNDKALQWYKTAYDNGAGPDALRGYAFSLKKAERYHEAQEQFKQLGLEIGSPYEYRREITACTIAKDWKEKSTQTGFSIAPAPFNSPQNDFSASWAPDGRLLFTSDRSAATGKTAYAWTGNAFMDLFIVEPQGASPQYFETGLNSPAHEGTAVFNKEGTELFLVKNNISDQYADQYCRIFTSQYDNGIWTTPTELPFQKERINYLHPALAPDGNTLYFSCNDPEGWGGYDIYAIIRQPNSETGWGDPKLLSRSINTAGDDLFPVFDADTLYFASDGHTGMGGLDIYKTWKADKSTWVPALNLKSPINSGADDFGFLMHPPADAPARAPQTGDVLRTGFFTTNRANVEARGGDDIYSFVQRVPPPLPPKKDTTSTASNQSKMWIEGYVVEKIFAVPDDPNSKVLGRRPLSNAMVTISFGAQKKTVNTSAEGYFKIEAADNTDYLFVGIQEGYLSNSTRFSTKGMSNSTATGQIFEVEIVLDKIYRDREIVLDNIYYDYNQWAIRPDAMPTLNQLADMLRQNPDIRIELGSHTDCRGNDQYNQTLSQRRAESAVEYLVGKGIAAERLSAAGYGEQHPSANCNCTKCSEEEHQMNRRTTFRIQ